MVGAADQIPSRWLLKVTSTMCDKDNNRLEFSAPRLPLLKEILVEKTPASHIVNTIFISFRDTFLYTPIQ